jgi:hypothetical protein
MTDKLSNAVRMLSSLLSAQTESVTEKNIDECIKQFISPLTAIPSGPFYGLDTNVLKEKLLNIFHADMAQAKILEGRERREPWLTEAKQQELLQWHFWRDYKKFLLEVKLYPRSVVDELDRLTDTTLDRLFDPKRHDIVLHKKGMVVGHVQSGKTSNYTGLICKAADAGFDFIIVLAGTLNNLRSQTQLRLDEGFLGFDTQYQRVFESGSSSNMGVGKIPSEQGHPIAHSYTSSIESGDFKKRSAESQGFNFNTKEPILLVVKKNKSVLTNLEQWIMSKIAPEDKCSTKSLLLIDDEADYASINTHKDDDSPTAINFCIRNILNKFQRVGYVGYTATPFANVFIPLDDTDLFPRDFIINLPAPPNYIGPSAVFGMADYADEDDDKVIPIVNVINDYEDFVPTGHKKNDPLPQFDDIPDSLRTAVKSFILTCAIRLARGQEHEHNSMLIHVSRYQVWQMQIKELVEKLLNFYRSEIEYGDAQMMAEFKALFEVGTDTYPSYKAVTQSIIDGNSGVKDPEVRQHSWGEIKPLLKRAVTKIQVKALNGTSADVLSYYDNSKNGLSVIVIGGDKLSRGLTLEGLSVSYFLRASKMYDTLMQMGRWFGYRPGYCDLCRLFTSGELNEWFRHISTASNDLRREFDAMCDIGATPDAYRLKVRTHPGCLQITAANKMRHSRKLQLSWACRLLETYALPMEDARRHINFKAAQELAEKLPSAHERVQDNYLWRGVDSAIVKDFICRFEAARTLKSADNSLALEYIKNLNSAGELCKWNVMFVSKGERTVTVNYSNDIVVGTLKRTRAKDTNDNVYCIRKNHIISRYDDVLDLTPDMMLQACKRMKEIDPEWDDKYPGGRLVREEFRNPNTPLLIIYTLDPYYANPLDKDGKIDKTRIRFNHTDEPFVGYAIAFPNTNTGYTVDYTANMVEDFEHTEDLFENDNDNVYNDNDD